MQRKEYYLRPVFQNSIKRTINMKNNISVKKPSLEFTFQLFIFCYLTLIGIFG